MLLLLQTNMTPHGDKHASQCVNETLGKYPSRRVGTCTKMQSPNDRPCLTQGI